LLVYLRDCQLDKYSAAWSQLDSHCYTVKPSAYNHMLHYDYILKYFVDFARSIEVKECKGGLFVRSSHPVVLCPYLLSECLLKYPNDYFDIVSCRPSLHDAPINFIDFLKREPHSTTKILAEQKIFTV
jgi:hypothetical protein